MGRNPLSPSLLVAGVVFWAALATTAYGQFLTSFRLDNDGDKVAEIKAVDVDGVLITEVTGQNPRQLAARDARIVIYSVAAGTTKRAIFYARYRDVCSGSEWSDWRVVAVCTLQSIETNFYFRLRVGCVGNDTTAARAWYQLTVADGMTPPNPRELDAVRFSYDIICETPAPKYEQLSGAFPESVGEATLTTQRVAGELGALRKDFGSLDGLMGDGGTLRVLGQTLTRVLTLSSAQETVARERLDVDFDAVFANTPEGIRGEFVRATKFRTATGSFETLDLSLLGTIKSGEGRDVWRLWQVLMKLVIVAAAMGFVIWKFNSALQDFFQTTQTFGPKVNVTFLGIGGSDGGVVAALIYVAIMATLIAVEVGLLVAFVDALNASSLLQELLELKESATLIGRAIRTGIYWACELFPIRFAAVVIGSALLFVFNNVIAFYVIKTAKVAMPA